ncbi:MAG TPA: hypothetical protein VGN25_09145 [Solirubrobacteraceae bacterium]|nr:hypothetical protein [Solirubrobacteraceae bacterium]
MSMTVGIAAALLTSVSAATPNRIAQTDPLSTLDPSWPIAPLRRLAEVI